MGRLQGSIFVYASIAPEAKFRVTAGKPMVNLVVNVFRYPPGQEPHKMADDGSGGKKQLPEKEDNPASAKVPPPLSAALLPCDGRSRHRRSVAVAVVCTCQVPAACFVTEH